MRSWHPLPTWFRGREAIERFFAASVLTRPGQFRLVPTMANGQPAFATSHRHHDGVFRAHGVQVLAVTAAAITRIVVFLDPDLFDIFGLPQTSGATPDAAAAGD